MDGESERKENENNFLANNIGISNEKILHELGQVNLIDIWIKQIQQEKDQKNFSKKTKKRTTKKTATKIKIYRKQFFLFSV